MRWKGRASWACVALLAACGGRSLTTGGSGDGDSTGDAGDAGEAGDVPGATGGAGTGGTNAGARGGNPATGGFATGGVTGGRTGATGGTSGAVAGAAGRGGGACNEGRAPRMTFDTDPQGWSVKLSEAAFDASGESVAPVDQRHVIVSWTGTDGVPALGAVETIIPFTAPEQAVGLGVSLREPLDLRRTEVSLCVKLVGGLGDAAELVTYPGTASIYLRSGPQACYAGGPQQLVGGDEHPTGEWILLTFDPSSAPAFEDPNCAVPFDPSDVREIGVRLEPSEVATPERPMYRIDTLSY